MTKTFYTSNYDKHGTNPKAVSVSAVGYVPEDYSGRHAPFLAPTAAILDAYHAGNHTDLSYRNIYLQHLADSGQTAESIVDQFEDGTIFICFDYEDGDANDGVQQTCHRSFIADLLNASGLAVVSEL